MNLTELIGGEDLRREVPDFRPGDRVKVHVRVVEGEKSRTQMFEGDVIRRRGGIGRLATFTVRKTSGGVGVERVFPIESPSVKKVEIKARGHVRRARLYYLRNLRGKKARLRSKVRDLSGLISEEEADRAAGTAAAAPESEALAAEPSKETADAASAEAGETPDLLQRTRFRRNNAYAILLCIRAVERLFPLSGMRGIEPGNDVQRAWRDVHTVGAQIAVAWDTQAGNYGRARFGLPFTDPRA